MKSALLFALVLFPVFASADWEAKFTTTSSKGEFKPISGKVYVRPKQVRVDTPYPMDMQVYAKEGSKQVDAAIPTFKIRLSSKVDAFAGQLPACLGIGFDTCVDQLKLKKTGSEKCGEKTCDVFEGAMKAKGMKSIRLWHWAGEKDPIFAKSILKKSDGSEITTVFDGIEKKEHPDAFYAVPANYKDAGSIDKWLEGFSGHGG